MHGCDGCNACCAPFRHAGRAPASAELQLTAIAERSGLKPASDASLSGSGQHYALELEIPIGTDATDVTLSWALPAAAYVDRDEVETRGSWPACVRTVQFTGASDVEAPEYDAAAHGVASAGQLMDATRSH